MASLPVPIALAAALVAAAGSLVPVSAQEAADPESRKLLEEIASLRELLYGSSERNNERAIATLQAALASPKDTYEFYMESRKLLEFTEVGKRESDWREWRDRNAERLESAEHLAALQLQLRYLILTIRASTGPDEDKALRAVMADLMSFLDDLATGFENLEEHSGVLRGSALESPVAKRLKLDLTLTPPAAWARAPADVAAIYEQLILPMARASGNLRALESAWDKRIEHEGKLFVERGGGGGGGRPAGPAGAFRIRGGGDDREREREERRESERQREVNAEEFRKTRLPQLQWGKARDTLDHGTTRIATLRAMSAHVRENLDHPDAGKWLAELEDLAKGDASPAGGSPSAAGEAPASAAPRSGS